MTTQQVFGDFCNSNRFKIVYPSLVLFVALLNLVLAGGSPERTGVTREHAVTSFGISILLGAVSDGLIKKLEDVLR